MEGLLVCMTLMLFLIAISVAITAINRAKTLAAQLAKVESELYQIRQTLRKHDTTLHDLSYRELIQDESQSESAEPAAPAAPPAAESMTERFKRLHEERRRVEGSASPASPASSPSNEPARRPKEASPPPTVAEPVIPADELAEIVDDEVTEAVAPQESNENTAPTEYALSSPSSSVAAEQDSAAPLRTSTAPPIAPPEPGMPGAKGPPPRPVSVEERITRWIVRIAGAALALGGIFLVKYSFDHKLLPPEVRLILGGLFGIGLASAGEWMLSRSSRIAQSLTAAGIATLFAVVLLGMHVETVISKPVGFILMAAVAGAAVMLSLRQGPFVALLGLAGGFATPGLIGGGEHRPGVVFGYLFLLQLGLVTITRRRGWWWLSMLTLLAGFGWVIVWLAFIFRPGDESILALFLLGGSATFVLGTQGGENKTRPVLGWVTVPDIIRWAGAALGMVLTGWILTRAQFDITEWVFMGVIGAGCMVVARFDSRNLGLSWLAAATSVILLTAWRNGLPPESEPTFAWTVLAIGLIYAVGGYIALWGAPRSGVWAALSVLATLTFGAVGYFGIDQPIMAHFWGLACLIAAAAYGLGAAPLLRARSRRLASGVGATRSDATSFQVEPPLAVILLGAAALVALAVPIELERQWISVAWAVMVPVTLAIEGWLRVKSLRAVAWVLLVATAARLLLNPAALEYPIGSTPVFNWLLYGYGIPIVAFAAAAWMLKRRGEDGVLRQALEAITITLGLVLLTLEVRHFFHRDGLTRGGFGFHEMATYGIALMAAAMALSLAQARVSRPSLRWLADAALGVAIMIVCVGVCLAFNPFFQPQPVGGVIIFNWLIYAFLAPGILALVFAATCGRMLAATSGNQAHDPWQDPRRIIASIAGCLFILIWMGLTVRHGFHTTAMHLTGAMASLVEWATYPVVWMLAGVGTAGLSMWRGWPGARRIGQVIAVTALLFGAGVLCVAQNPLWVTHVIGPWPVLNWLLYAYLLPAALAVALALVSRRDVDAPIRRVAERAAAAMAFVWIGLAVRHGFHPSSMRIGKENPWLVEWATYVLTLGGAGLATFALGVRANAPQWQLAGRLTMQIAVAVGAVVLCFLQNPLWVHHEVGTLPVLNWLMYAYVLPAALATIAGRIARQRGDKGVMATMYVIALVMAFVFVNLEVRQAFHGAVLNRPGFRDAEEYTYSAAWVLFGGGLLTAGILLRSAALRWGSLAVLSLAIGKVFTFDVRKLSDILRVFSLIGLGLALLVVYWLYQKFVFMRGAKDDAAA